MISLSALTNGEYFAGESGTLVIDSFNESIWNKFFVENYDEEQSETDRDKNIQLQVEIPENAGEVDMDEVNRKLNEALKRVEEATRDLDNIPGKSVVAIQIGDHRNDSPYMGVVTDDLTLTQATDLGYNKFYGVLITRVVPNSPARAHKLLPDDIIMEINGHRVANKRIFSNIVDSYNIGDTVKMKIFRNRQEMEMNFTFGSRHDSVEVDPATATVTSRKPKIDLGSVEGGWIPVWYMPDIDDINDLISRLGFAEIDDKGQLLHGGGGRLNIGKGLFLGGMGAGYSLDRRIAHTIASDNPELSQDVIRRLRYRVSYGGITIDQRFALSRKFFTGFGAMLGWGKTTVEVSQNHGSYNWYNLHEDIDSSSNNYLHLSRSYIFLQPKAELMYKITDWLGIRGEAGYIVSYSPHSGWNIDDSGDIYQVTDSPDTSFNSLTLTVGPWFSF